MEKTAIELFAGVGGFRCGLNNVTLKDNVVTENGDWNFVWANQWEPSTQHQDASFLTFYQRFVTDPKFQQNSLSESVTFTGPDPEDDFSTMTGEILPEQWPVFAPWLPSGSIYNIVYGKPQQTSSSNVRYFLLRGISNGLQTDLMFVRKGGAWKLKTITT